MANSIFRVVGAGRTFLSATDFYIQANTNDSGQVEIVLPNSQLIFDNFNSSNTPYSYVGVRIADISNNASVNNIVIYGFESDLVNGGQTLTINTNGGGGIFTLIGNGQWAFNSNSVSGSTPTLQQVLDNNHDLVNGNNFQGTFAGAGNTGTNVIDVYINFLRKKIDKEFPVKLIHTMVGMGYIIKVDD